MRIARNRHQRISQATNFLTVMSTAQAGDRREAQQLGVTQHFRSGDQIRLADTHDIPDVAVNAPAMSKSRCHRANDIAVTVCEEGLGKELCRALIVLCEQSCRNEIAGIGVRIGKGVDIAFQFLPTRDRAVRRDNDVGLIERLLAIERDGNERELVCVLPASTWPLKRVASARVRKYLLR